MFSLDLEGLIYRLPAIIIALTVHEFSHGYTAFKLGDPTAKNMGRLTLNPLAHLDFLGTLMIIFGPFGWAKPVPFNPFYFHGARKKKTTLVALAGPLSNLILAFIAAFLLILFAVLLPPYSALGVHIEQFLVYLLFINIALAIFNLIPVPPLDGSKILAGFLPDYMEEKLYALEKYGFIILLVLIVSGALGFIFTPLISGIFNLISAMINSIIY
jgi:Zn-dependent protease